MCRQRIWPARCRRVLAGDRTQWRRKTLGLLQSLGWRWSRCPRVRKCKGDKSNIQNSTDHFCEDTIQNALAALTNLRHVTPIFTAWTPSSFDDTMGERNHFTGQQITRSDRSSHIGVKFSSANKGWTRRGCVRMIVQSSVSLWRRLCSLMGALLADDDGDKGFHIVH